MLSTFDLTPLFDDRALVYEEFDDDVRAFETTVATVVDAVTLATCAVVVDVATEVFIRAAKAFLLGRGLFTLVELDGEGVSNGTSALCAIEFGSTGGDLALVDGLDFLGMGVLSLLILTLFESSTLLLFGAVCHCLAFSPLRLTSSLISATVYDI